MSEETPAMESIPQGPIVWDGQHAFFISGTEHDEDTLRIPATHRKDEQLYSLTLPTLCITYADMNFANAIGGVQEDYPASSAYGPQFFNPPVTLSGAQEIEKFTWIRGAEEVTIGPRETIIRWRGLKDLVIPQLRIRAKEKAEGLLTFKDVTITAFQPFAMQVLQYADGRHIGGLQVTKAHPRWEPVPLDAVYDLFVRAIDGETRQAIPEARVRLFTWDDAQGTFVQEAEYYTNSMGIVDVTGLPVADRKLVTVGLSPWLTQTWRFRPLPGQKVRMLFKLWQHRRVETRPRGCRPDVISRLARMIWVRVGSLPGMDRLRREHDLGPEEAISIPYYEAIHHVEARDTLDRIADYFCYQNAEELAAANDLAMPVEVHSDQALMLPGWMFFQAEPGDLFESFDDRFGLPVGWSRPAQRTYHDDPTRTYESEIVAVPMSDFARQHELKRSH